MLTAKEAKKLTDSYAPTNHYLELVLHEIKVSARNGYNNRKIPLSVLEGNAMYVCEQLKLLGYNCYTTDGNLIIEW